MPQRPDVLVDPQFLFEKAHLQPGMHVADLGCGRTGYLVFPASRVVGASGIVYAVDILKEVLEVIQRQAAAGGYHEVQTVWSDIERVGATAIHPKSLDLVFLVNTLIFLDNRHGALEEAHRLLKSKARLVLVDWKKKGLSFSPSDERFVDFDDMKRWATSHGFVLQEEFAVGPYHYGCVFYRND